MQNELPQGFTLRPVSAEDAERINQLICESDIADYGEPDFSVEDLHADWRRSGFQLERDAWLIVASEGVPVAYGNVYDNGDVVRVDPTTCVHPQSRECGLEEILIRRAEEWTRTFSTAKTLQWIVNDAQSRWTKRFETRGYYITRHDYVMEIAMKEPPPLPGLAQGFEMRAFERGHDERSAWACLQESFRDHRGHSDMEYPDWATGFFDHANWSSEFSTVVMQETEMVAAAMVFNFENGGWIRQLGVRRPWRQQGLGLAMLHHIFGACYARGITRVGLGVDAENLTGATRLYERAGMKVKEHFMRYEKIFAEK